MTDIKMIAAMREKFEALCPLMDEKVRRSGLLQELWVLGW